MSKDFPSHQARKRFGQNFLHDAHIITRIVQIIDPKPLENIVEIGPGLGALTWPLLQRCKTLTAIELDRDLFARLQAHSPQEGTLTIYQDDILKFDLNRLMKPAQPMRIVGNLPYNITTPLLFHLFEYSHEIRDIHIMVQKEVGERLAASANSADYGRLSIMAQYYCVIDPIFHVPPHAFTPAPKVDSSFLRLTPRSSRSETAADLKLFAALVNQAFQQRRKTLRNALKYFISSDKLRSFDLDPNARPEQLSVDDFVRLSNYLQKAGRQEA